MKNIIWLCVLAIGIVQAQTPIDSIQFISQNDLATGTDLSYKDGDTVTITGVVTMNPCLYGLSSGPNRVGTFLQAADGHAWGGVHVLIDPSPIGYPNSLNDLDNDVKFIDNFTIGSTVTCTGIVTDFSDNTQVALLPIQSTAIAGGLTDTMVVTIDQFMQGTFPGTIQHTTGEQWEGTYVEIRNVAISDVQPNGDRFNITLKQGSHEMQVRDVSGHLRNDDFDKFCTGSSETPTIFTPPAIGSFLAYVRGVIVHATLSGNEQYLIAPIVPSDFGPQTQAVPVVSDIIRDPIVPTSSQTVDLTATIVDPDGTVTAADLYYSFGYGNTSFSMVSMTDIGNDQWMATVPAVGQDSAYVNYWIRAFDNDNNHSDTPDSLATNSFYWVLDEGITSIGHIQFTPSTNGSSVWDGDSLSGISVRGIVTASAESYDLGSAIIQDGTDPWHGLYVWGNETFDWNRGDEIEITAGVVEERFGITQMDNVTFTVLSTGNALPSPITTANIDSLAAGIFDHTEPFESMYMRFDNVTVIDTNADAPSNFGEWSFHTNGGATTGLRADDFSDDFPFDFNVDSLVEGQTLGFVRGIFYFSFGNWKLLPRNMSDIDGFNTQYPRKINTFSFILQDTTYFGSIDQNNGTIGVTVFSTVDVSSLTPTIEYDGARVTPSSGATQDFSTPVTYTVVAPIDSSTKDYVVTVDTVSPPSGIAEHPAALRNINIFPNPAQDEITISLDLNSPEDVTLSVYNLLGESLWSDHQSLVKGDHQIVLGLKDLAEGVYLVEISGENFRQTQKLTVVK